MEFFCLVFPKRPRADLQHIQNTAGRVDFYTYIIHFKQKDFAWILLNSWLVGSQMCLGYPLMSSDCPRWTCRIQVGAVCDRCRALTGLSPYPAQVYSDVLSQEDKTRRRNGTGTHAVGQTNTTGKHKHTAHQHIHTHTCSDQTTHAQRARRYLYSAAESIIHRGRQDRWHG